MHRCAYKRLVVKAFEAPKFRRRSGDKSLCAAGEKREKGKGFEALSCSSECRSWLGFGVCSGLFRVWMSRLCGKNLKVRTTGEGCTAVQVALFVFQQWEQREVNAFVKDEPVGRST